jgi:hypothetical protein
MREKEWSVDEPEGGGGAAGVLGCGWLEVVPTDAKDKLTGVA